MRLVEFSRGFPPIAATNARALILGSMPGSASLRACQYYAFPRNVFWDIMGELFGAGRQLDYASRLRRLTGQRIALWDVVGSCRRKGSLDSAISEDGLVTNDFAAFFENHAHITHLYFNGTRAASLFRKRVAPGLCGCYRCLTLPSTSPAHAAMPYAAKLEAWSVIRSDVAAP